MGLVLHIARHAALHPRSARLRARQARRLRAVRPSRRNELWYRAQLGAIVDACRAAGHAVAEALRPAWPLVKDETVRGETEALRNAAARFGNIDAVAQRLAALAARKNLGEVDSRLAEAIKASVGVDVSPVFGDTSPVAEELERAIRANVDLITSIPAQYLERVRERVTEAFANGDRWESLVEGIAYDGDVTESRAALIARDQTSKMNSAFNRVRQTSVGIEKYVWQTAGDERVRDEHADLDGETFSWDDPPIVDGEPANPGEPIACRCVGIPVFDLDEAEGGAAGALFQEEEEELAA